MGEEFFSTPNPAFGAVFTYYLKDGVKSQQALRREGEIEIEKAGGDTPYPAWDALRAEDQEEDPALYLMVRDANGALVRQVPGDAGKGMHRSAWDLRLPAPDPINLADTGDRPYWVPDPVGPLALPGDYTARLAVQKDGILQEVGDSQTFTVKALEASPEISKNRRELQAFQLKVTDMQRAVAGTTSVAEEIGNRITHIQAAIIQTAAVTDADRATLRSLSSRLANLNTSLNGDATVGGRNEPAPMSISSRVNNLYYGLVYSQASIAGSYRDSYQVATTEFTAALAALRSLEQDVSALETALEVKGAPWTPGRIPVWSAE
jgi:hypothetical protein